MLFSIKDNKIIGEKVNSFENKRYKIDYEGLIFIKGLKPGYNSLEVFADQFEKSGTSTFSILSGNFICCIKDKKNNIYYIINDNGGSKNIYYSDNYISTSFLNLLKIEDYKVNDLVEKNIVEYIITGFQFTKDMFLKNIKKLDIYEYFKIKNSNLNIEMNKSSNPFLKSKDSEPVNSFLINMEKITKSLADYNISVDLTGGTDTRITTEILNYYGLNFETATSGTKNHSDILISKKVAKQMSLKHKTVLHKVNFNKLWEEIDETFLKVDGLCDPVKYHRLYKLFINRKQRGVDISIGSSGGELYKDGGWWRTALKVYGINKNEKIINHLIDSGLIGWGIKMPNNYNLFSSKLNNLSKNYKSLVKDRIKKLEYSNVNNKFKFADKIFYEYSVRSPRGFIDNQVINYSPLLDPDLVKIGINLNNYDRFFHRFYRMILDKINSKTASINTNRGNMVMSKGINNIFKDFFNILYSQFKENNIPKNDPELYNYIKKSSKYINIINSLKEYDILNKNINASEIEDYYVGKLINLYKIIEIIDR
mgnify:CR=1 FL=1